MFYVAYKATGEVNGFYTTEIHKEIPDTSFKISRELWKELISKDYEINIDSIELYRNEEIGIEEKDIFFKIVKKINIEPPETPKDQLDKLLSQQIALLNIENQKKDVAISNLSKMILDLNIKINQLGGVN